MRWLHIKNFKKGGIQHIRKYGIKVPGTHQKSVIS